MDMGREGKLERLAELKESRLLHKLEECAIRSMPESFFVVAISYLFSRVRGASVDMDEYRNCSQSFLRGIVINSFREEIEKGTDLQLLLSQN